MRTTKVCMLDRHSPFSSASSRGGVNYPHVYSCQNRTPFQTSAN